MTESHSGETNELNTELGRRAFCVGAATTVALAGAGVAAADDDAPLNYGADVVPNPFISSTTSIATHEPDWDALEYEDDEGEVVELPAVLDDRDPDDADETTANLYGLRADRLDASDYRSFPRDVTYEDSDGDEQKVTVIDPDEWTAGTDMTVAEGDLEIDSVSFSTDGLASGSSTTSTFDTEHADVLADADPRQYFQLGVNVDSVSADALVEFALVDDSGGAKTVAIDPSGDDDVVATATGSGIIHQVQLGDLSGSLDEITAVEITITDADADVTLFALNGQRKSRWEFGTRVVDENTDDEETETIREPSGTFYATDLEGELVSSATRYELELPLRYDAASSAVETSHALEETDRYPPYNALSETHARIEVPTAYELSHADLELEIEQELPDDRYHVLDVAEDTEDTDDEDVEGSDRRGDLPGEGEFATLEEFVSTGVEYSVIAELKLTDDETGELFAESGGGAFGARSSGGGGWFSGARGAALAVVAAVTGYFGLIRRKLPFTG